MRKNSNALMLLPVVGLAVFALLARKTAGPPRAPGLFVEDINSEPLTPREVSDGHDRRLRITLNYAGKKPAWWGSDMNINSYIDTLARNPRRSSGKAWNVGAAVLHRENGRTAPIGFLGRQTVWAQFPWWEKPRFGREGRYVMRCKVKLQGDMGPAGETKLLLVVGGSTGPLMREYIELRRSGEKIVPPDVSRETELRIVRTRVRKLKPVEANDFGPGGDHEVAIDVECLGDDTAVPLAPTLAYIEDEAGRRHEQVKDPQGKDCYLQFAYSASGDGTSCCEGKFRSIVYRFYTGGLPKGRLTLKGAIGAGDNWPKPFQATIRTGKEALSKLRPSSIKLVDVGVRKATHGDKAFSVGTVDTTAIVSFRTRETAMKGPLWIHDYSQHLVDARGLLHWEVKTGGGQMPIFASAPKWNVGRKCWQAHYYFSLAQMPRGPVRFRAELGLKGEKLMQVDALVRK